MALCVCSNKCICIIHFQPFIPAFGSVSLTKVRNREINAIQKANSLPAEQYATSPPLSDYFMYKLMNLMNQVQLLCRKVIICDWTFLIARRLIL